MEDILKKITTYDEGVLHIPYVDPQKLAAYLYELEQRVKELEAMAHPEEIPEYLKR